MTAVCHRMPSEYEGDSPAKCRERRRRRIEMRRLATVSNPSQSTSHHRKQKQAEKKRVRKMDGSGTPEISSSSSSGEEPKPAVVIPSASQPAFGIMSVSGRSREMEDAVSVNMCLIGSENGRRGPVHFFAVFDGHGGPHVAELCRDRMHELIKEEFERVIATRDETESGGRSGSPLEEEEAIWRGVMQKSFDRMDAAALTTCACGCVDGQCDCHPMEIALGGSTAVVAAVTANYIVVANCGDSRAVLCRGGRAIPLSDDHKPDRIDELARIEAAGGRVIFVNGARVEGILAMSRAIGDKYLKSVVISEPEVTFTKRESDDECLILASDGLWDVLSSDLACDVARECLQEGMAAAAAAAAMIDLNAVPQLEEEEGIGTLYPSQSALAAALLTRLALGRKSMDNISAVVVDLKRT